MHKGILSLVVIVLLVVIGASIYSFSQQKTTTPTTNEQSQSQDAVPNTTANNATNERYLPYTDNLFEETKNKKRVLFFYASWCPTCRPADEDFTKNSTKIPEDVLVIRVNYNDPETDAAEKALAEKYGITYQHTYVQLDADDNQVTKWNGGSLAELLTNVK